MTADEARWIVEWATETGSLVFLWVGSCGVQPILMPGDPFYWWLEEPKERLSDEPRTSRIN